MTTQEDRDDLDVLERILGYIGNYALRGKQPTPAQYLGLLGYAVEDTPRFAEALRRLIDRHMVSIVKVGGQWVLAEVAGRGSQERLRLRAEAIDPAARLSQLAAELRRIRASLNGATDDPQALIAQAGSVVDEIIRVTEQVNRPEPDQR